MIHNETKSIKYTNPESLCVILDCQSHDLLEYNSEESEELKKAENP